MPFAEPKMASRLMLLRPRVARNLDVSGRTLSRRCLLPHQNRLLSSIGGGAVRRQVSKEERVALRAARRERATQMLQQEAQSSQGGSAAISSSSASVGGKQVVSSRWIWYLGMGIPTVLLVWGLNDESSPPAKLSELIGLTGLIKSYTDQIAKPSHEKLLPDWSQVTAMRVRLCGIFKMNYLFETLFLLRDMPSCFSNEFCVYYICGWLCLPA